MRLQTAIPDLKESGIAPTKLKRMARHGIDIDVRRCQGSQPHAQRIRICAFKVNRDEGQQGWRDTIMDLAWIGAQV